MSLPQMPTHSPVVDSSGKMTRVWQRWFADLSVFVGADAADSSSSSVLTDIATLSTSVSQLERDSDAFGVGRQP